MIRVTVGVRVRLRVRVSVSVKVRVVGRVGYGWGEDWGKRKGLC